MASAAPRQPSEPPSIAEASTLLLPLFRALCEQQVNGFPCALCFQVDPPEAEMVARDRVQKCHVHLTDTRHSRFLREHAISVGHAMLIAAYTMGDHCACPAGEQDRRRLYSDLNGALWDIAAGADTAAHQSARERLVRYADLIVHLKAAIHAFAGAQLLCAVQSQDFLRLYRGVRDPRNRFADLAVGSTRMFLGFTSATTDVNIATSFAHGVDGVLFEMYVPPEIHQHVALVDNVSLMEHEAECLFPPDLRVVVVRIHPHAGARRGNHTAHPPSLNAPSSPSLRVRPRATLRTVTVMVVGVGRQRGDRLLIDPDNDDDHDDVDTHPGRPHTGGPDADGGHDGTDHSGHPGCGGDSEETGSDADGDAYDGEGLAGPTTFARAPLFNPRAAYAFGEHQRSPSVFAVRLSLYGVLVKGPPGKPNAKHAANAPAADPGRFYALVSRVKAAKGLTTAAITQLLGFSGKNGARNLASIRAGTSKKWSVPMACAFLERMLSDGTGVGEAPAADDGAATATPPSAKNASPTGAAAAPQPPPKGWGADASPAKAQAAKPPAAANATTTAGDLVARFDAAVAERKGRGETAGSISQLLGYSGKHGKRDLDAARSGKSAKHTVASACVVLEAPSTTKAAVPPPPAPAATTAADPVVHFEPAVPSACVVLEEA